MMKYETQSSAVMLVCQVLLSALLYSDHQKETDGGVTLDSVRKFYLIPGMICSAEPYFDITCSSENTYTSPTEGIFFQDPTRNSNQGKAPDSIVYKHNVIYLFF